jgi:RNA polymerase sigma factor (sigma-70 family)
MAAVRTHAVAGAGTARVAAVVARHERTLLRVARQASLCEDDAHDAYQRALEIFLRRVDTVDPATELGWLRVVVRHEAMAIRRARSESVTGEDLDVDAFVPGGGRSVDELIASSERVTRSAEALRALKPDEAKALMLKAHGLSYTEIGERCGWSYTKVNRSITEGRRRFMAAYDGIESGAECERFAPIVQALADGNASSKQVLTIRPHLRHCTACRATVRDLHLSRLRRASLFWPLFAVAEPLGRLSSSSAPDAVARPRSGHLATVADVKQQVVGTYYRVVDPTPLAGVRPGAAAAAIAGCLAIGGGATYCAERGVDPVGALSGVMAPSRMEQKPAKKPRAAKASTSTVVTPTVEAQVPTPEPMAQPEATPALQPAAAPSPTTQPEPTPAPSPVPQEEYEPVTPAGGAASASQATPTRAKPAPAPATGPGEFDGP